MSTIERIKQVWRWRWNPVGTPATDRENGSER